MSLGQTSAQAVHTRVVEGDILPASKLRIPFCQPGLKFRRIPLHHRPMSSTSEDRQQGRQLPSDWSDPHRQPFALGFPREAWAAAMERPDARQQRKALQDAGYILVPNTGLGFSFSHSMLPCVTNSFGWSVMGCSKQHFLYEVAQQSSL